MASVWTEQIQRIFHLNILISVKHKLVQILCIFASIIMKQYSYGTKSIIFWLKIFLLMVLLGFTKVHFLPKQSYKYFSKEITVKFEIQGQKMESYFFNKESKVTVLVKFATCSITLKAHVDREYSTLPCTPLI